MRISHFAYLLRVLADYVAPVSYWVLIEGSLALVSSCLPVLRPVFGEWSLGAMFSSFANLLSIRSNSASSSSIRKDYGHLHGDNSSLDTRNNKHGFSAGAVAVPQNQHSDIELSAQRPAGGIMVQKGWRNEETRQSHV